MVAKQEIQMPPNNNLGSSGNHNPDLTREIAKTIKVLEEVADAMQKLDVKQASDLTFFARKPPVLIWEKPETPSRDSKAQTPEIISVQSPVQPALRTTLESETPDGASEKKDQRKSVSLFQLSNILQQPYKTIRKALEKMGIEPNSSYRYSEFRLSVEEILLLYNDFIFRNPESVESVTTPNVESVTTPKKEVPLIPKGAVSIKEFVGKAGFSYETLRGRMELIDIRPIKIGKQKFLTQELQVALLDLLRRAPGRSKTVQAQVRQKPLAKGSIGKHALIKGAEARFFEGKIPGESLPAKEPDEAGRLYLAKFRRLERERRRLAAEQGTEQTPGDGASVQLHFPQKPEEDRRDGLRIGWQFTILHPTLGEKTFEIVAPDNVDAKAGKISSNSPLAQAINGHSVGEKVVISAPAGQYEVKLVSVVEAQYA